MQCRCPYCSASRCYWRPCCCSVLYDVPTVYCVPTVVGLLSLLDSLNMQESLPLLGTLLVLLPASLLLPTSLLLLVLFLASLLLLLCSWLQASLLLEAGPFVAGLSAIFLFPCSCCRPCCCWHSCCFRHSCCCWCLCWPWLPLRRLLNHWNIAIIRLITFLQKNYRNTESRKGEFELKNFFRRETSTCFWS